MDTNPIDLSAKKELLYKDLLNLIIEGLEKGAITVRDSEEISREITKGFDNAQDIFYLKAVLEDLSEDWPFLKPALLSFETEEANAQDQAKAENVQKEIESLKNKE